MRILVDASVLQQPLTGVGKAAVFLYRACLRARPDVEFTALHRKPLLCELPAGVKALQRGAFVPGTIWRRFLLPYYVRGQQSDAIHFPWNGNVPKLDPRVRVVTTLHDVLPLLIPNFFKSSEDESTYRARIQQDLDRTHLLFADSEFSKKEILKHFKARSEPVVLRLGPTIPLPDDFTPPPNPGGYFLYVGGYDRRKGLDGLLRVFLQLKREGKLKQRLILTGSKNYFSDEFKRQIEDGAAMGALEERGYITDAQLIALFTGATALVYPSKYEGYGLPPLEAMCCGCPVITTRETSIPEIAGDAACYVDPADEQQFADALIAMETNPALREKLRAAGLKQAAKFSWSDSAALFLKCVSAL